MTRTGAGGGSGWLSRRDRVARGKDARAVAPLDSHAEFTAGRSRDPVGLLLDQTRSRVPELVPIRHGRMLVSPFTFYRGAALPMAAPARSSGDVKRLAASLAVAGRGNEFPARAHRKITLAAAGGYRAAMRSFAGQPLMDVWYAHLDIEPALRELRSEVKPKGSRPPRRCWTRPTPKTAPSRCASSPPRPGDSGASSAIPP